MSQKNYQKAKSRSKPSIIIWVALAVIIVLITWASFAKIDQVTRAQATVMATGQLGNQGGSPASEGGTVGGRDF